MVEEHQPESQPTNPNAPATTWRFSTQVCVLGGLVILLWALVVIDLFLPKEKSLLRFGIHSREVSSLHHIFFMPFLHAGFGHVIANTFGLLTLGWLVLLRSSNHFLFVSLVAMVISGLGVWIAGAGGVGASGVIYGYFGFLLMWGYYERSAKSVLLALLVAVVFGSMIWGILPQRSDVSWQGHLFGLLGGALAARYLAYHARKTKDAPASDAQGDAVKTS
jgi:membrane associated rhomboid family serine protease